MDSFASPLAHAGMSMRIEILNTGTELLLGQTLNTHGAWIGRALFPLGLRVSRQMTVPDGAAIRDALAEMAARADVVIVTGGLGPTSDDITRELAAEVFGLELMEDESVVRSLEEFFARRNRPMAAANRKQALIPVGGEVLPNPNGTAPGVYLSPRINRHGECAVFLLPGPPREMQPMFTAEVMPRLKALAGIGVAPVLLELKLARIGESDLHDRVDAELAGVDGLEYGYCARLGEVDVRLIGDGNAVAAARNIVLSRFAEYLVSEDGAELEEVVIRMLRQKGWTIAVAESCTGGLICSRLTDIPGASDVFTHGFITYANRAKTGLLGVDHETLDAHGAVSREVADQMAQGALRSSGADISVAVTGIAGPGGGTPEKPLGTVWIAVATNGGMVTECHFTPRERTAFKRAVSQLALDAVRRVLGG